MSAAVGSAWWAKSHAGCCQSGGGIEAGVITRGGWSRHAYEGAWNRDTATAGCIQHLRLNPVASGRGLPCGQRSRRLGLAEGLIGSTELRQITPGQMLSVSSVTGPYYRVLFPTTVLRKRY
ncbi:hypothetical protein R1flu_015823 [Riccia fluitans]|uniref:Uncharacterized protein n=1 Tax=Riccia fluitans TaxID=41844 RepID=A0ABD1YN47_9MARC